MATPADTNAGAEGVPTLLRGFTFLGAPIYGLGRRPGPSRGGWKAGWESARAGLAIGFFLWAVLLVLALIDGLRSEILSLAVIDAHVRLLVTIPLFFLCESRFDFHANRFVVGLVTAEVVPKAGLASLEDELRSVAKWSNSWLPEVLLLLLAVLATVVAPQVYFSGGAVRATAGANLSGVWDWVVCMTVFRFVVLRWLWRIGAWAYFLWRLSRLELRLVPTHPDGAAGLGYLEAVHEQFGPLVFALSALQAALFAEQLHGGTLTIDGIFPQLVIVLVLMAILFLAPVLVFLPNLAACRYRGHREYMDLASKYVNAFESKWINASPPADDLLGTADLQSLADLTNSVSVVRRMRLVPFGTDMLLYMLAAALLPMVPLVLFIYPFAELTAKVFKGLLGV